MAQSAAAAQAQKAGPSGKPSGFGAGKVFDTLFGKSGEKKETSRSSSAAEAPPKGARLEGSDELRETIISILFEAGVPMTFEKLYQKLQTSGVQLPEDRPKLVVRKLLYSPKLFRMLRGTFSLAEGIHPGGVLPAEGVEADVAEAGATDQAAEADQAAADAQDTNVAEPEQPVAEEREAPPPEPPPPAAPAPAAPRVGVSAIPPGHYTRALEAILGTDVRVRMKKP